MVLTTAFAASWQEIIHLRVAETVYFLLPQDFAHFNFALLYAVAISVRDFGFGVILFVVYRLTVNGPLADLGFRKFSPWQAALGVVLFAILHFVETPLFHILHVPSYWTTFARVQRESGGLSRVLFIATIGFVSPVVQEAYFRGSLLPALQRFMPATAAILIGAVLFSAWHYPGTPRQLIDTLLAGLITGAVFMKTRSLTAPCAMHIATNCYALWALMRVH